MCLKGNALRLGAPFYTQKGTKGALIFTTIAITCLDLHFYFVGIA